MADQAANIAVPGNFTAIVRIAEVTGSFDITSQATDVIFAANRCRIIAIDDITIHRPGNSSDIIRALNIGLSQAQIFNNRSVPGDPEQALAIFSNIVNIESTDGKTGAVEGTRVFMIAGSDWDPFFDLDWWIRTPLSPTTNIILQDNISC